jgi:hypothetical protein
MKIHHRKTQKHILTSKQYINTHTHARHTHTHAPTLARTHARTHTHTHTHKILSKECKVLYKIL